MWRIEHSWILSAANSSLCSYVFWWLQLWLNSLAFGNYFFLINLRVYIHLTEGNFGDSYLWKLCFLCDQTSRVIFFQQQSFHFLSNTHSKGIKVNIWLGEHEPFMDFRNRQKTYSCHSTLVLTGTTYLTVAIIKQRLSKWVWAWYIPIQCCWNSH